MESPTFQSRNPARQTILLAEVKTSNGYNSK